MRHRNNTLAREPRGLTGVLCMVGLLVAGGCDAGDVSPASTRTADSDEIVENLVAAGYERDEIRVDARGRVIYQGDIVMTLEASRSLSGAGFRQYVTTNLVSEENSNISVFISPVLDEQFPAFRNNVGYAVTAWDSVDSRLHFTLVEKDGDLPDEPRILIGLASGLCANVWAESTFPGSDGQPGEEIEINPNLPAKAARLQQGVMMHEIGHAVGLRHTDFKNRASCGTNRENGGAYGDPEGEAEGARHIPGTSEFPSGDVDPDFSPDRDSVMNACMGESSAKNTFSTDDKAAILHESVYKPTDG
ncbi:MAG: zinc-dependent metalloprotease [Deltaproteobacteria bacterium]|nr:zinc-dependent metalloprotease [Deltaproteobacteria bacterium]